MKAVKLGEKEVFRVNVNGVYYAIENGCHTHARRPFKKER